MWLCHESIYQAIYQPHSRLIRPPQVSVTTPRPAAHRPDHRRAHQRPAGVGQGSPSRCCQSISGHSLPPTAASRGTGKATSSSARTSARRSAPSSSGRPALIRLMHLPTRDADSLRIAIATTMGALPSTLDPIDHLGPGHRNGPAHRHHRRPRRTGLLLRLPLTVAAWQQRERQRPATPILPQGHQPDIYTPDHLRAVEYEINNRPRHILEDRSPAELFAALLTSPDHQLLRR